MVKRPPRLVGIGGLSGTGKSTVAACLAPRLGRRPGALHLRSDVERKRMFRVAATERLPREAYAKSITDRVYERLRGKAEKALRSGLSVVVDAVHELSEERRAIEEVASMAGAEFSALWLEAEAAELLRRVAARRGDASDADAEVVMQQLTRRRGPADWQLLDAGGDRDAVCAEAMRLIETA